MCKYVYFDRIFFYIDIVIILIFCFNFYLEIFRGINSVLINLDNICKGI